MLFRPGGRLRCIEKSCDPGIYPFFARNAVRPGIEGQQCSETFLIVHTIDHPSLRGVDRQVKTRSGNREKFRSSLAVERPPTDVVNPQNLRSHDIAVVELRSETVEPIFRDSIGILVIRIVSGAEDLSGLQIERKGRLSHAVSLSHIAVDKQHSFGRIVDEPLVGNQNARAAESRKIESPDLPFTRCRPLYESINPIFLDIGLEQVEFSVDLPHSEKVLDLTAVSVPR